MLLHYCEYIIFVWIIANITRQLFEIQQNKYKYFLFMSSFTVKQKKSFETNNPEEQVVNYTQQQRKGFGIANILTRFKNNSFVASFSSPFADMTRQFEDKLNNQVRYNGNCSDLWGLLQFQLKAIGQLLTQKQLDPTLTKKNAELGQIYMLYKTESKIERLEERLQLKVAYIQKLNKFRQQIIKIKSMHAKRSSLSQIQDQIQNKQYYSKANQLLSYNFSQAHQQKNKNNLKAYLKKLIQIVVNSKSQIPDQKTKLIISLICMILLFVIRNLSWTKVCLSNFSINQNIVRFLAMPNGATKIAKYLHDATSLFLKQQFQLLESTTLLSNIIKK